MFDSTSVKEPSNNPRPPISSAFYSVCEKMNYKLCDSFVKNSVTFCQNKAIANIVISLNLSATCPVIRRIPLFCNGFYRFLMLPCFFSKRKTLLRCNKFAQN